MKKIPKKLVAEWDDSSVSCESFSACSHKKVWWKCTRGHRWMASIKSRYYGSGCPYCNHKKLSVEESLAFKNPKLTKDWHPTKNGKLKPQDVFSNSHKKVWWNCKLCNYEWEARICDRNTNHNNCVGCRSVLFKNNILSQEWHPTKNTTLNQYEITIGKGTIVWWRCLKCGNEWQASIKRRMGGRNKCSRCNSLGLKNPSLSEEWCSLKNGKLTPYEVSFCSGKKVWWECKNGHIWKSTISSRCHGSGCPYCKKIILTDGFVADSRVEALLYLKLKNDKMNVLSHGKYGKDMGGCLYDFYIPTENKYIEVTGYDKRIKWWNNYIVNIERKKKYVQDILGGEFQFVQYKMSSLDYLNVRKNMI